MQQNHPQPKDRLAAVSYLNTLPLILGFQDGPQRGFARLLLERPAVCAELVRSGEASAGLLPIVEARRQGLPFLGDTGIACRGAVRSILILSKLPLREVRSVAADVSSRSSVALTRVLLANHFGNPDAHLFAAEPDPGAMLSSSDACLIIGDPALRVEQASFSGLHVHDLGEEWYRMTGLPMVFAVWSGNVTFPETEFRKSLDYGLANLDRIVDAEAERRGIAPSLAHDYLTRNIVYDIGPEERRGSEEYLRLAAILEEIPA